RSGPQRLRLVAVHDPEPERFPELLAQLRGRGIAVYRSYEELLALPIKALWLPVPIDLHRVFTERALAAGKAVLCEKPAAGCVQDVDAMIRARDAAKLPVAVGYQHLYVESTHQMKRRILDGELGRVADVTISAAVPRNSTYFARSWAGKMRRDGTWLLDSPANNAIAHFVHLALFLLGPEAMSSARPVSVEAELYRVNEIENYDTCCIRLTLENGPPPPRLLICLTHATRELWPTTLVIHGEKRKLTYGSDPSSAIWESGDSALPLVRVVTPSASHPKVLAGFEALLEEPTKPHASLEMSRMHAIAISGASQAAPVVTIPLPFRQVEHRGGGHLNYIPGIAALFDLAVEKRQMLHEMGLAPWSVPAGRLDLQNYTEFTGPAK
ncbi:MAG: Gfo/Idh/MocA family oxidoreductase, partial [Phycisphaerales bacterium]|nr:Gfo/Idh/MocA family oxidoreductase [Phycisphaerales bacterium]